MSDRSCCIALALALDEAGTIDGDVTSRIARLATWLALEVANAAEHPRWDQAARRARHLAP
jgi:hypothetical protein